MSIVTAKSFTVLVPGTNFSTLNAVMSDVIVAPPSSQVTAETLNIKEVGSEENGVVDIHQVVSKGIPKLISFGRNHACLIEYGMFNNLLCNLNGGNWYCKNF